MTLDEKLYEQIRSDLLNDFPDITSITCNGNIITIHADIDTLWNIYDVLHQGVDIELNLDVKDESFITITF